MKLKSVDRISTIEWLIGHGFGLDHSADGAYRLGDRFYNATSIASVIRR